MNIQAINIKQKICTVVLGHTLEIFLTNLAKAQTITDFVELRVDDIKNLKAADLKIIKQALTKVALFTCRAKEDGGNFLGNINEQAQILQAANDLGFDYIDIDLNKFDQITIKNKQAKIIISYHNFESTPDDKELMRLANQMRHYKADVLKFAVMANNEQDVNRLFKLLINKQQDEKMIVLGMGQAGIKTRLLSPLLGGLLSFAALDDNNTSAPGQISVQSLVDFYSQLRAFT